MKRRNFIIWFFVVLFLSICLIVCIKSVGSASNNEEVQSLRGSLATKYCEDNEWILEIKEDEDWTIYWMCNFSDWTACEISSYFRWECGSFSEKVENLDCLDWTVCDDTVEDQDISSWIEDMNSIDYDDLENLEDFDAKDLNDVELEDLNLEDVNLEDIDLEDADFDDLYDIFSDEFNISGDITNDSRGWKSKWWENNELSVNCRWIWWTVLGWKCYLSDWIEIVF